MVISIWPGVTSSSGAIRCSTLVTCALPTLPARTVDPNIVRDGVVAWSGELLTYAGPYGGFEGAVDAVFEAATVIPGFVDCHTHLPFFGWRADEYEARLAGVSYRELHGEGGIRRSARMLREAADEAVLEFCRPLLAEMLGHGTTTVELKTGYGLSVEDELRQARLARKLADEIPQTATVTLLACHAVPDGTTKEEWVSTVCKELIPRAAAEHLVDAVDVFVEDIAFSVDDLRRVAGVADREGLALRCHADQLGNSEAGGAAASLGARSADHLNHLSAGGVKALAESDTVGVLLPGSTLMLQEDAAPSAELLEAGAAVAVATDFNPGTAPILSMPEAIALACSVYRLPPLTALVAATANPAWILGRHEYVGSLEPGKRADFVVLDGDGFEMVPYRPGHNPVRSVFIGGTRVAGRE
jgi:imidazolonepropionase